jgi:hypothetical protein
VAWRHAVDGELQRTILSLIEIELACVDEDEAISRAMFASAMNVFWEISSTWQSPKLFDAWHISLDRVEVHCIAHPVLAVDPQIPMMLGALARRADALPGKRALRGAARDRSTPITSTSQSRRHRPIARSLASIVYSRRCVRLSSGAAPLSPLALQHKPKWVERHQQ